MFKCSRWECLQTLRCRRDYFHSHLAKVYWRQNMQTTGLSTRQEVWKYTQLVVRSDHMFLFNSSNKTFPKKHFRKRRRIPESLWQVKVVDWPHTLSTNFNMRVIEVHKHEVHPDVLHSSRPCKGHCLDISQPGNIPHATTELSLRAVFWTTYAIDGDLSSKLHRCWASPLLAASTM
jgi:hypothetical protein